MKIAVLSITSGVISRGVEAWVEDFAKRLKKEHWLKVYTAANTGTGVNWRKIERGSWRRKFMADYWAFKTVEFTLRALKEIDKERVDIVVPMSGGWQTFLVRLYCWWRKKKMAVIGQAGLGWCDRWNIYMKPDVFVALSKRNLSWTKKYSGKIRVEVIPNGVDLKRFGAKGRKMNLGLEKPVILCVAGHDRYKRVEETIKAVVRLKKGSLLLVGGSKEQGKLGKKVLGKRFLKRVVGYGRMPEVYRTADLFVLVSESSEAFGIAYLEALSSGLRVVATDDKLRRELLGPYGVYVEDPGNTGEFAEKIRKALKKGGVKTGKWLEKYDWDKVAGEYEKLFLELTKQ